MTKKELCERLIIFFDKDLDDEQKTISYCNDEVSLTFDQAREEMDSPKPDYDRILDYFRELCIYEIFGFCGCGCNDAILSFILEVLNCFQDDAIDQYGPPFFSVIGEKSAEAYKQSFSHHNSIDQEFMLKWLDSIDLTEHGTSIYNCWLTDKGVLVREILRETNSCTYADFLKEAL